MPSKSVEKNNIPAHSDKLQHTNQVEKKGKRERCGGRKFLGKLLRGMI